MVGASLSLAMVVVVKQETTAAGPALSARLSSFHPVVESLEVDGGGGFGSGWNEYNRRSDRHHAYPGIASLVTRRVPSR